MSAEPRAHRLFFALWPDEASRAALAHATHKASRASGGRPIPAPNLHSTLAFLGSVTEARMALAVDAAAQLRQVPFRLVLDRLEHWPKPALLCATCSEPPSGAADLASGLWKLLVAQGFVRDSKPYRPHVTIARKVSKPHAVGSMRAVDWAVDEFALVESTTLPEGSQYSVLQRWPLRG